MPESTGSRLCTGVNIYRMVPKFPVGAVIFDLDGTLVDTEPSAAAAVQKSFKEWNVPLALTDAAYVTGITWEKAFAFLFKKYSLPVSLENAKETIFQLYREELEKHLTIVPGSVEAVQALSAEYPLGLVSGSNREDILWCLRKLKIEAHFKVILGAEDYPESKPSPVGYLKALNILQVEARSSLVFEDSSAGIAAARSAGMWVVAITSTNHFNQDVSGAHARISDFKNVSPKWIQNLSFE